MRRQASKRTASSVRRLAIVSLLACSAIAFIAVFAALMGRSSGDIHADAIQYTLEGQIYGDDYTTGNLCAGLGSGDCWHDGDNVPHRLTITGLSSGQAYTALQIQHDFKDADGVVGYADFHALVCTSGCAGTAAFGAGVVSAAEDTITYGVTFTTGPSSTAVQLDWLALLGPHAHLWNGSSLHVRLVAGADGASIGNKEVPLPVNKLVPPPTATPTNTATNTPVAPTATFTSTPTSTTTPTWTSTPTATATATATNTTPPTNTATATNTPVPFVRTATPTNTAVLPTNTAVPPTSTPTNTPVGAVEAVEALPRPSGAVLPSTGDGVSNPERQLAPLAIALGSAGLIAVALARQARRRTP